MIEGERDGLVRPTGDDERAAIDGRRRILMTETTVGVIVAAGLFPLILWLAKAPSPVALGGPDGFIADAAKATIPAVFLMTLMVTFELRLRGRAGKLGPLPAPQGRWLAFAPKGMFLRTLLCTALALVTLAPLRVLICWSLGLRGLPAAEFALVNVVYGFFIGVIIMPPVVLAALADLSSGRLKAH